MMTATSGSSTIVPNLIVVVFMGLSTVYVGDIVLMSAAVQFVDFLAVCKRFGVHRRGDQRWTLWRHPLLLIEDVRNSGVCRWLVREIWLLRLVLILCRLVKILVLFLSLNRI